MDGVSSAFLGQSKCEYLGKPSSVLDSVIEPSSDDGPPSFEKERQLAINTLSRRKNDLEAQLELVVASERQCKIRWISCPLAFCGVLFLGAGGALVAVGENSSHKYDTYFFRIVGITVIGLGIILILWATLHAHLESVRSPDENYEEGKEIKRIDRRIVLLNSPENKSFFTKNKNYGLMNRDDFTEYLKNKIRINQESQKNEQLVVRIEKQGKVERDQEMV